MFACRAAKAAAQAVSIFGVAAVVDLGRLGEFLDGKILVFFRCHSVLPLIQRYS